MESSELSTIVSFDINEEGVSLRLSLAALRALTRTLEERAKQTRCYPASEIIPVQNIDQNPKDGPLLTSVSEATAMLGICPATLYKLLKSGALRAVKCGGRTLIPMQALREYAKSLPPYAPLSLREGGITPKPLPSAAHSGHQKLKFRAVMALTGLSRHQLYVRRNAGTFPLGSGPIDVSVAI